MMPSLRIFHCLGASGGRAPGALYRNQKAARSPQRGSGRGGPLTSQCLTIDLALPARNCAAKSTFGAPSRSGRARPDRLGTPNVDFAATSRVGIAIFRQKLQPDLRMALAAECGRAIPHPCDAPCREDLTAAPDARLAHKLDPPCSGRHDAPRRCRLSDALDADCLLVGDSCTAPQTLEDSIKLRARPLLRSEQPFQNSKRTHSAQCSQSPTEGLSGPPSTRSHARHRLELWRFVAESSSVSAFEVGLQSIAFRRRPLPLETTG